MPGIRHVVLFGFKPEFDGQAIGECVRRFGELQHLVPGVRAFEWGVDVSPENLANGHSHCFQMAFDNEAERDAYLVHPAHVAFTQHVGPMVERVTVIDYRLPE